MTFIDNKCSCDRVVYSFNFKEDLTEENRMNYRDNNQIKIAILVSLLSYSSFCHSIYTIIAAYRNGCILFLCVDKWGQ